MPLLGDEEEFDSKYCPFIVTTLAHLSNEIFTVLKKNKMQTYFTYRQCGRLKMVYILTIKR